MDFYEQVYQVVRQIPSGRVSTYGHSARFLGAPGSARMVGWAMNASHNRSPPVPAHRVVNRMGRLTGKQHFATPEMMQQLLEQEGVTVVEDQVMNFHKHLWDPAEHLKQA